ncbi:hypothetical protein VOLCADRAFT_103162 [Volvox carteri f. nagariensis]|uniref:Uncharacterized protein n=1 Tax=Volvox carteri f. nagariensis TaxID=3068 RepID=D8TJW4_VOLCA|nr:uncharacterized protein VOLCADRAFT_103162 [Volvox carteri f. nagariensis]EFJ51958.1 hypothetical protein VOLCADRAFT_103162 [Volvox carteri f. nagariensis]|eukprot:XP_002946732.1 hypothetical protein VOLCADRAFT_103162 [Volvox carteri f. nagariensis]
MKASGQRNAGASPGGPLVSVAKRRSGVRGNVTPTLARLAALDVALSGAGPRVSAATTSAEMLATPQLNSVPKTRNSASCEASSGTGEFPYNSLADDVLDGSLSAALADAKAAAAAAAQAVDTAMGSTGSFTAATSSKSLSGVPNAARASSVMRTAVAAAAAAAAAGGDSVAAEVLAQMVATNPRTNSSDLRNLLAQRLQDRSVMLENPTAPVNVNKLFLVGSTGIVLKQNSKNLHLVMPGDRVQVVPLKGCVVQYTINGTTLQFAG